MDSFNVLRGREPIRKATTSDGDVFYCAGYIKYMPRRGRLYGIEFSGTNTNIKKYRNPAVGFDYYIFCSENAWIDYVKEVTGVTLPNKLSKSTTHVGNPATFVVSSDTYTPPDENPLAYPHNIGFAAADYDNAEPRPYANVDGFVNSNDVQYPMYIFVKFASDPNPTVTTGTGDDAVTTENTGINELDYQIIYED